MRFLIFLLSFSFTFAITLQEAVKIAVKNQTKVINSTYDLKIADEEIRKAMSGILPSLSFSYSYVRLSDELAYGFSPKTRQSFSFDLNQTIFNKAVFEALKTAKIRKELQKAIYEDVKREVIFRTKVMFYSLLYKRKVVEIRKENLKYWEENFKTVKDKYERGIIPRIELLRSKAELENAKAQYKEAYEDYKKSLEEFKAFLRLEKITEPEGELSYKELNFNEKELLKKLYENNSTLKVARENYKLLKKRVDYEKSKYFPTANAFLSYEGYTVQTFPERDQIWIKGYTFGFSINWNIFDGFSREASISQAKYEKLKQLEKIKDLKYSLKAKLLSLLGEIESINSRIRAVKVALEASREALQLSTQRYKYGVATQLEVLDAVRNYNETLERLYFLYYQYNSKVAEIERLTE